MWIITEDGNAANLVQATDIMIFTGFENNFEVKAIYPETPTVLKSFDNIDDAKAYVKKLVNKLNTSQKGWVRYVD